MISKSDIVRCLSLSPKGQLSYNRSGTENYEENSESKLSRVLLNNSTYFAVRSLHENDETEILSLQETSPPTIRVIDAIKPCFKTYKLQKKDDYFSSELFKLENMRQRKLSADKFERESAISSTLVSFSKSSLEKYNAIKLARIEDTRHILGQIDQLEVAETEFQFNVTTEDEKSHQDIEINTHLKFDNPLKMCDTATTPLNSNHCAETRKKTNEERQVDKVATVEQNSGVCSGELVTIISEAKNFTLEGKKIYGDRVTSSNVESLPFSPEDNATLNDTKTKENDFALIDGSKLVSSISGQEQNECFVNYSAHNSDINDAATVNKNKLKSVELATLNCGNSPLPVNSSTAEEEYIRICSFLSRQKDLIYSSASQPNLRVRRSEFARIIVTQLNAICSQSAYQMRDKYQQFSLIIINAEEDATYCKYFLAQKLIGQAQNVSSKAEFAFTLAPLIALLWAEFPDFGDFFLACTFDVSPYLIPFVPSRQSHETQKDYNIRLGYKYDPNLEDQSSFLKRLRGLTRLFTAVAIYRPSKPNLNIGVETVWRWLARILNTSPIEDVTATLLLDILLISGFSLCRTYGLQFSQKLMDLLAQSYYQHILKVSHETNGGPANRLFVFLQNFYQDGRRILAPKGELQFQI